MKKLLFVLCAAVAVCIGMASCSNDVQDVNVVSMNYTTEILYSASSSSSTGYATLSTTSSNGNYQTYQLYGQLTSTSSTSSTSYVSETFYKIGGKWYTSLSSTSSISFSSGEPGSDEFVYKGITYKKR